MLSPWMLLVLWPHPLIFPCTEKYFTLHIWKADFLKAFELYRNATTLLKEFRPRQIIASPLTVSSSSHCNSQKLNIPQSSKTHQTSQQLPPVFAERVRNCTGQVFHGERFCSEFLLWSCINVNHGRARAPHEIRTLTSNGRWKLSVRSWVIHSVSAIQSMSTSKRNSLRRCAPQVCSQLFPMSEENFVLGIPHRGACCCFSLFARTKTAWHRNNHCVSIHWFCLQFVQVKEWCACLEWKHQNQPALVDFVHTNCVSVWAQTCSPKHGSNNSH